NDDGVRIAEEVTVFGKGSRYRRVYLHRRAREWLMKYLATRKDNDKALFVTQKKSADGSYRMTVWTAEQIVRDAAKRAGLSEDVSPHWLRHAAITFWAKDDLTSAQRLAGHRQIATTQRYLGSSDAELKAFFKRQAHRRSSRGLGAHPESRARRVPLVLFGGGARAALLARGQGRPTRRRGPVGTRAAAVIHGGERHALRTLRHPHHRRVDDREARREDVL